MIDEIVECFESDELDDDSIFEHHLIDLIEKHEDEVIDIVDEIDEIEVSQ